VKVHRILAITLRVFRGFRHDPRSIGLMIIAPIVAMSVFGIAFGGEVTNIDVIIVNDDTGFSPMNETLFISNMIIDNLDPEFLNIKYMDSMDDAVKQVEDGEVWAAIHFPSNFSSSLTTGRTVVITIRADMSNPQVYSAIFIQLQGAIRTTMDDLGMENTLQIDDSDPVYGEGAEYSDFLIPGVIAFAIFMLTTLLTLLSFTSERVNHTLDRLLVTPATEPEIVFGYALAFGIIGTFQAIILVAWGILAFDIMIVGSVALAIFVTALLAIASQAMGILLSAAARTEAQAVQFIPLIVLPVFLLSGIFWPIQAIPGWLRPASYLLPPTYAVDALRSIMVRGWGLAEIWPNVLALLVFIMVFLTLATLSLRRKH
jgi:ABC-2 type transport system permease protein